MTEIARIFHSPAGLHYVPRLKAYTETAIRALARSEEGVLRDLLGRWVSELEPCVVRRADTREILGLAWADDPEARIVVAAAPAEEPAP